MMEDFKNKLLLYKTKFFSHLTLLTISHHFTVVFYQQYLRFPLCTLIHFLVTNKLINKAFAELIKI
jgi:hypothetical protein